MFDGYTVGAAENETVPGPRRAIVGRHADGPCVVPQPASDGLREWQPAMTGDNPIQLRQLKLLIFCLGSGRREDELINALDTPMHHREPATGNLDVITIGGASDLIYLAT